MRTLKTLLVISLFSVSALGADFAGTYVDYRNMIRLNLGLTIANTNAYSDSVLNQFIRQAVVEVNPVIRGAKSITYVTTLYQKNTYTLDTTLLAVESVEWIKKDTAKGLKYVSRETFWQQKIDETMPRRGFLLRPSFYDFFNNTLFVYPSPTINGDSLRIIGYRKVPSLADSAKDSLSVIPQAYRGAIIHYATWLAARARRHPATDVYKKDAFEAIQLVNEVLNKRKNPSDSGR